MIRYQKPDEWMKYDGADLLEELSDAKASVLALSSMPYQREWVEELQQMQLKREVAGTSRIEGADFTEGELDAALKETPEQLLTRSQRQVHAAMLAYRWIAGVPDDRAIDSKLICELHSLIVTGADDDHCPPGRIRERDQNVNFGSPHHRGAEGGQEAERAFQSFSEAIQRQFRDHDVLIQALAMHYHLAAMHPFLDGNGRTARALEAIMLQRAGLRSVCFIPMSNYYYDEKRAYLANLAEVRANHHDLTAFLAFGLKGIAIQCQRLLTEVQTHVTKALYRNLMFDLFHRLRTPKRRVLIERQLGVLKLLLEGKMTLGQLIKATNGFYSSMRAPEKGLIRDLNNLIALGAIQATRLPSDDFELEVRLTWPTEITETEFFERVKKLPKAKTYRALQS